MHIRTSVVSKKGRDGKRTAFQIEFRDPTTGERWRRSLGTKDAREAERKRSEIERRITHGTFDPRTDRPSRGGVTLALAYADFLRAKQAEGLRPKTLDNYESVCGRFVASMHAAAMPGSVRAEHVEAFVSRDARDGGKLSVESRATYLRALRVFFRWMKAEGLIPAVPEVKRSGRAARSAERVRAFLSPEAYTAFLNWTEAYAVQKGKPGTRDVLWVADAVRVAVGTGLRRGELCRLRWRDVSLKAETLTVRSRPGEETKSGHERTVPVVGDALTTLRRLNDARTDENDDAPVLEAARGGAMDPNKLSGTFLRFRTEAGLPDAIHLHSLRHTYASWWVINGGSLYKLRDALGHANVTQTQVYAHLHPDATADEARRSVGAVFARLNGPQSAPDAGSDAETGESDEARENARLRGENERLRAEVARLRALLVGDGAGGDGAAVPVRVGTGLVRNAE